MKSIEKLAFQGQNAARMGIITTAYIQQALGTLLQSLCDKEVNLDRTIQSIRDIFAMSTKSLDQIARSGAFHHLIRRKAVMEDIGLSEIKELKNPLVSLPLSSNGVFGDKFEQTVKERVDKDKQLKELLPELHFFSSNKFFSNKRKGSNDNDWSSKRQKNQQNKTRDSNAKTSGIARNNVKSSTSTGPSHSWSKKETKFDNKTDKGSAGNNFRPSFGSHWKNQQKKMTI